MFLIKNARVIDPANNFDDTADILIKDGRVAKVAKNINEKAEILDAKGLIAAPGFIDMHVHLREPGFEGKETVYSGTRSAIKGGFTTVAMMPNTDPAMDSPAHLKLARDIIKKDAYVNVEIIGSVTKGRAGGELVNFAEMKQAGAIALSDDGSSVENDELMRAAVKESVKEKMLLISHAEDTKLAAKGVMHEGFISSKLGLRPISSASEYEVVKRDVELAKGLDARVHIAHVSTKESCEIIAKARSKGVEVTAEITPHHFTLTEEACQSFNGNTKMNPPLRSKADLAALKQAIKDGVITVIATDHAPHAVHEKEVEFDLAMFGIIGLETALPLTVTELVEQGIIDYPKMVELLSVNPAKILGLKKGTLGEGADADIVLFDPEKKWVYAKEEILSASKNTPFIGREMKGQVRHVFVGGELKFKDGELNA